jgi:hypothetical protein
MLNWLYFNIKIYENLYIPVTGQYQFYSKSQITFFPITMRRY